MAIYNNNSTANYREYADDPSFDVTNLTIAAWVRPRSIPGATARIAVRGVFSLNGEFSLGSNTAGTRYRMSVKLSDSVQYDAIDTVDFSANARSHLVGRVDTGGDTIKLYKDGSEVASTALAAGATFTAQATAIRLFQTTGGAALFDTEIAELAIWDAVLTTDEITRLANGISPQLIRPSALVIYDPGYVAAAKDRRRGLGADTGTLVSVDHPRIFKKSPTRIIDSGNEPVASSITGSSTVTANVNLGLAVASTILGGSTVVVGVTAGNALVSAFITGASSVQFGTFGEDLGGYGVEAFGDPFGAGGPISLVNVRAIASHVLRVVFNEEPLHQSAAGKFDSRNPANYLVEAVVGEIFGAALGTTPTILCMGVDPEPIFGPAKGVKVGEVAMDIHLDKAVVQSMVYKLTVNQIRSKFGGILGFPYFLNFPGILPTPSVNPPRNLQPLHDWHNLLERGTWIIDDSGDIQPEDQIASLKKRITRRLTTIKGAYAFLPDYGIGLALKEPMSVSTLQSLKSEIVRQIRQEPEVEGVSVSLELNPLGLLIVTIAAKTKAGAIVNVQATRTSDGVVLL